MTPALAFKLAHMGVKLAATIGAGQIVGGVVARNVAMPTVIHQVTVRAGAFALGASAGKIAADQIDYQFNEALDLVEKIKQAQEEHKASQQTKK